MTDSLRKNSNALNAKNLSCITVYSCAKQTTQSLSALIGELKEQLSPGTLLCLLQDELAQALAACLNMDERFVARALNMFPRKSGDPVEHTVRLRLKQELIDWINQAPPDKNDLWGELYQKIFSKKTRQLQGEFYTPSWLSRHLWDRAQKLCAKEFSRVPPRVVDPGCGSGSFLLAGTNSMLSSGFPVESILDSLCGFDINPLSVLICRANLLFNCMQSLSTAERNRLGQSWSKLPSGQSPIPVYVYDSIEDTPLVDDFLTPPEDFFKRRYDIVVGNPPWINWDKLSEPYRQKTLPLWIQYGLFSLSGSEARLGGAKKELASLMLFRVADKLLDDAGILAMVLPWSLFQTQKSGEGFRGMQLRKNGTSLAVLEVDDFTRIAPFPGIMSHAGSLILRKGERTTWPVSCRQWNRSGSERSFSQRQLRPLRNDCPASAWIVVDKNDSPATFVSQYQAQLGCNSAGANNVFWLEMVQFGKDTCTVRNMADRGKTPVEQLEIDLETELLFPLLRWKNVDTFVARSTGFVLITQDALTRRGIPENVMQERYPLTMKYLQRFEPILKQRACVRKLQKGAPFWSMYNINEKTFAPYKVVWRRMDNRLRAAAVGPDEPTGKPILPQETCCLIAVDSMREADYLAAVLNSDTVQLRANSLCLAQTRGFGSPGILPHLGVEKFDPERQDHLALAARGKLCRNALE